MAEFTLQALADEIDNDPEGIGYKVGAVWKGDQVIADLINAKNLTIDRNMVGMETLRGDIEFDWYDALSIDEQEYLRWQTPGGGGGGDVSDEGGSWKVTDHMKLVLTGRALTVNGVSGTGNNAASWWATADRGNAAPAMLALIEIPGGRAEVLWGEDILITAGDVGRADNL